MLLFDEISTKCEKHKKDKRCQNDREYFIRRRQVSAVVALYYVRCHKGNVSSAGKPLEQSGSSPLKLQLTARF